MIAPDSRILIVDGGKRSFKSDIHFFIHTYVNNIVFTFENVFILI